MCACEGQVIKILLARDDISRLPARRKHSRTVPESKVLHVYSELNAAKYTEAVIVIKFKTN